MTGSHVRDPADPAAGPVRCDACGTVFEVNFVFQRIARADGVLHACQRACREALLQQGGIHPAPRREAAEAPPRPPVVVAQPSRPEPVRLAVLNQKGGTGKTTTAVNLSWGLAESGARVLLVDVDAQGHVGVSMGRQGPYSLYHVLSGERTPAACIVPVREGLDILPGNETLATAEIMLSRMDQGRDQLLRQRMGPMREYDFVLFDCGPSLSLLNMNVLTCAGELLVPVSCDYLSLVGVRQIVATVNRINDLLGHPVGILGVLPTFYDQRNRISDESVRSLKAYFKDLVLPPIRVNTQLKEAPSRQMSIFEHAPDSRGAEDYRRLVRTIREWTARPAIREGT
jgi:chromosome partitioning protein